MSSVAPLIVALLATDARAGIAAVIPLQPDCSLTVRSVQPAAGRFVRKLITHELVDRREVTWYLNG